MSTTRVFLLASALARLIEKERGGHLVRQGFFPEQPNRSAHVQVAGETGHLILVSQPSASPLEEPVEISRSQAEALLDLTDGRIEYLSILTDIGSHSAAIQRFAAPAPLDLISLVFNHDKSARKFRPPAWFGPEVTSEPSYQARSIALAFKGKLDAALEANAVARRLDSTNRNIVNWRGFFLIFKGQPGEALQVLAEARSAFPEAQAGELRVACMASLHMGQYDEAVALCERSSALETYSWTHALLAAAYATAGDAAKAATEKDALLKLMPGLTIARYEGRRYCEHPACLRNVEAHFTSGLRKAGVPEQ